MTPLHTDTRSLMPEQDEEWDLAHSVQPLATAR